MGQAKILPSSALPRGTLVSAKLPGEPGRLAELERVPGDSPPL